MTPRQSSPGESPLPKVLFIDNSSTFGGAIIGLERLVKGLDELGIDSYVLSGQSPEVLEELFGDGRAMTLRTREHRRRRSATEPSSRDDSSRAGVLSRVTQELSNIEWIARREVPAAVKYAWIGYRQNVDLIHLNNGLYCQFDGFLASKLLGAPCIAHTRGFHNSTRLLKRTVTRIDRHIAISRAIERNLLDIGATPAKVALVHDAVDFDKFARPRDTDAIRRELGIPPGAPTFGFLGRMIEWKGVREFTAAALRVLQRQPEAHALVVGDESDGDPSYFRQVKKLAHQSSVADRCVFTGYRTDVAGLMQTLDLLVHTSLRPEPFGLVLIEAMAAGTAVIAADRGGPLDIVVDGETGFLVDPLDEDALVTSIGRILDDPDLARRMGQAGQKRSRDHFGLERHARDVAEVYRQVQST